VTSLIASGIMDLTVGLDWRIQGLD